MRNRFAVAITLAHDDTPLPAYLWHKQLKVPSAPGFTCHLLLCHYRDWVLHVRDAFGRRIHVSLFPSPRFTTGRICLVLESELANVFLLSVRQVDVCVPPAVTPVLTNAFRVDLAIETPVCFLGSNDMQVLLAAIEMVVIEEAHLMLGGGAMTSR